jgi:hypothetical protein
MPFRATGAVRKLWSVLKPENVSEKVRLPAAAYEAALSVYQTTPACADVATPKASPASAIAAVSLLLFMSTPDRCRVLRWPRRRAHGRQSGLPSLSLPVY